LLLALVNFLDLLYLLYYFVRPLAPCLVLLLLALVNFLDLLYLLYYFVSPLAPPSTAARRMLMSLPFPPPLAWK